MLTPIFVFTNTHGHRYIRQCGEAQLASLQRGDPRAVWVLQGWLFVFHSQFWKREQIDAYIGGLKRDSLLVLDLISEATPAYEQTNSYHGSPWVWNVLHNFGGSTGLRGNLATVMTRPYAARALANTTMAGIGATMEAINQNPIMYELALSHAWEPSPRPLDAWVTQWAAARYGAAWWSVCGDAIEASWKLLLDSAYNVLDPTQGNGFWGVHKSVRGSTPICKQ